MPESNYLALFLIGLLGGTHCVGMCGGIVGALSMSSAPRVLLHLAYNVGRIASYVAAGALAGALGEASLVLADQFPLRMALYLLANLMLVALGLYLMGVTKTLAFAERFGQRLWRMLQPFTRHFLPANTVLRAFPLGLLWGWLPCGLVYSALITALSSGSALQGAGMMLAFGAGTLPNLLMAGFLATRLQGFVISPAVRFLAGTIVLAFGIYGLWGLIRAAGF